MEQIPAAPINRFFNFYLLIEDIVKESKITKYLNIIELKQLISQELSITIIQSNQYCHQLLSEVIQNIQFRISLMNIQSQPPKITPPQQNYEEDYEQDGNNDELQVLIQQKQPQQQFFSLTNANDNQVRSEKDDAEQKANLIGKLKAILNSKIEEIKQVKKNIANSRKQIKDIGEEVDKQMNKSILKHSKPHTNISIQQIFNVSKQVDPQVSHLNSELAKIRAQSKKIKNQIKVMQNQVNGPVNQVNFERASEFKAKLKENQAQLKKLKQQKQYLQVELKEIQDQQGGIQLQGNQQIKQNKQKNTQILNQLKEQKNAMYQLEKQDRTLTEKIKYIEELDEQTQFKKSRATVGSIISKEQIENSIKQIIQEIKQILEKRNKLENQRKNTYKLLQSQVVGIQAKNWQIINKLRDIDAKLLKHYNSKLKKPKVKKQSPHENISQDVQNKKENDFSIKTAYATTAKNDKNVQNENFRPEPLVMIQKRKIYDFFMAPTDKQELGNITLSDEMLGNKLMIKRLSFVLDQNTLYGLTTDYLNEHNNQIHGYKIMPRIRPKDVVTKVLVLDNQKNQLINFIHIGVDKNDYVKYIHFVTSQAKQLKWGNLQWCDRNEQKIIRKYEGINLKGKLNQISDKQAPNYYCLAGLGVSIIYLSSK